MKRSGSIPRTRLRSSFAATPIRARATRTGALADYNEAIRLSPQYAYAYANRGMLYERFSDFEKARSDFKAVGRVVGLLRDYR